MRLREWRLYFTAEVTLLVCVLTILNVLPAIAQYNIYRANLHVHTSVSTTENDHPDAEDPRTTVGTARNLGLDAIGFSDHDCSIDNDEWNMLKLCSDDYQNGVDGQVALRGFEWTYVGDQPSLPLPPDTDKYEHVNVFGTSTWVTANNNVPKQTALLSLYEWLSQSAEMDGANYGQTPVAQFNHIWLGSHFLDFDAQHMSDALDKVFCLAEIGGYGVSDYHRAYDSDDLYRMALQKGWHVAPSIGRDNYRALDQSNVLGIPSNGARTYHTAILAEDCARSSLMDALRQRRVFASESRNIQLRYLGITDGNTSYQWMGSTLRVAGDVGITLGINLVDPDSISPPIVKVVSVDGYEFDPEEVSGIDGFTHRLSLSRNMLDSIGKTDKGEWCFFVRVKSRDDLSDCYTYSAPIWIQQYNTVSGVIESNATWTPENGPYLLEGSVTIPAGITLSIEPGTIVKFGQGGSISVQGQIVAQGTAESPIYFTSAKDDSVGGDTNGDDNTSSPAAGDWHFVQISGVGATGTFDHCVAKYGGYQSCGYYCYFYGILDCRDGGTVSITNSTISSGSPYGISCDISPESQMPSPTLHVADSTVSSCASHGININSGRSIITGCSITGCTLANNGGTGAWVSYCHSLVFVNNTFSGNGSHGLYFWLDCPSATLENNRFEGNGGYAAYAMWSPLGNMICRHNSASGNGGNGLFLEGCQVSTDCRLYADIDFPYVVGGQLTVASEATLTIDPGTVIKSAPVTWSNTPAYGLVVNGSLVAQGTAASPVNFTSIRDDSVGGDTNGDGNTTVPTPGDWGSVYVNGNGSSGIFEHCVVKYGGYYNYGYPAASLTCNSGGTMTITDCTVTHSQYDGIYSDIPGQVVKNCIVAYNGLYGVCCTETSPKVLYCDLWSNGTNYYGSPDLNGTIYTDPLLVNTAGGDYHLQDTSPCIDTGDPTMSDPDGTCSDMGALPYTNPIPRTSIAGSKTKGNTETVRLAAVIVTAAFPDYFYVEADDRSCGIRVNKPGHSIAVGMCLDITGVPETSPNGERCIAVVTITPHGTGSVRPLAMNNRAIGGGAFGFQDGIWVLLSVKDGSGNWHLVRGQMSGLSNIGLLIRIWGRLTYIDQHTFTIDDGSGQNVKCVTPSDVIIDPTWDYVDITGISSCEKVGVELRRLIRIQTQSDIVQLQ